MFVMIEGWPKQNIRADLHGGRCRLDSNTTPKMIYDWIGFVSGVVSLQEYWNKV